MVAAVRVMLVWLLLLSAALGDERLNVPAGLITLSVPAPPESDITWEVRDPIDLESESFLLANGQSVCVFYAASGRVIVVSDVIDWDAKKRTKKKWIIDVEGDEPDPEPDPEPQPRPEGFAGEVYDKAKEVGDPVMAKKIAQNYSSVAAAIAAGGFDKNGKFDMLGAKAKIKLMNAELRMPGKWYDFGVWLRIEINKRGQDKRSASEVFFQVADGLEAA